MRERSNIRPWAWRETCVKRMYNFTDNATWNFRLCEVLYQLEQSP
jgi:hypothetical protein